MDFVSRLLQRAGAPPIFNKPVMDMLAEGMPLPTSISFPAPVFTCARKDGAGRKMPQAIAHRGYKAKYPENTMAAFRAAVDVGVHALETDVHLTKDGTVVLSHDPTLQRCFGVEKKLVECDWSYVSTLRSIKAPHEPMPRLVDLLNYLCEPGNEKLWLLLDIKLANDATAIMKGMAQAVESVQSPKGYNWRNRIILGVWAAKYIPLAHEHFPGFSIANIGFSITYSRQFLSIPNLSFNVLQATLVSPWGRNLLRDAKSADRQIYSWTVNDETNMDWCIRKGLDGVITDEAEKFVNYCRAYDEAKKPAWPFMLIVNLVRINVFAWLFGIMFSRRHGFGLEQKYLGSKAR